LATAERLSLRVVVPGDPVRPTGLDDLAHREPVNGKGGVPVGIWVRGRGRLDELLSGSLAIVGARSATTYGASVAGSLAAEVARAGVTVVSGGAFGIDQAAHWGALAVSMPTVAVLACGADRHYPAAHRDLLDRIADHGAVVSEVPPGWSPTRLRFLARNRLIAAMTQGTLVVEAAHRSGALNTANWAARLGRPLLGVPGPVTSAQSEGVHELLRSGQGLLVTRGDDVLEALGPIGELISDRPRGPQRPEDALAEPERRVLEALPVVDGVRPEALARTAGMPVGVVRASLVALAELGLAETKGGRWRIRRAS
jgi:DNA processing protein